MTLQLFGKLMKPLSVYLSPAVLKEIDQLPGHVRQRIRHAILELRANPFPPAGKRLATSLGNNRECWRIRIERWRVLYVIDSMNEQILVVAVRRRPPYQYEDLDTLLSDLG